MTNQSKECRYCNFKNLIDSKACKTCGADVADWYITVDQPNTLGTTMEARINHTAKLVPQSQRELFISEIYQIIAQSKTDLLNALIDREEGMKKDARQIRNKYHPEIIGEPVANEQWEMIIHKKDIYNQSIIDTINHLKSLRDEK